MFFRETNNTNLEVSCMHFGIDISNDNLRNQIPKYGYRPIYHAQVCRTRETTVVGDNDVTIISKSLAQ